MPDIGNFERFFSKLKEDDIESWAFAYEHVELIVRNWCRKNKLEIEWIADEKDIYSAGKLLGTVCTLLHEKLTTKKYNDSINFPAYKRMLILIAEEQFHEKFNNFYHLLEISNDRAWKCVDERLGIYAIKWFSNRNYQRESDIPDIYNESLKIMLEKISGNKLFFKNSSMLKSYFFSILDNKTKEYQRKNIITMDIVDDVLEGASVMETNEYDDTYFSLKNELNKLADTEQYILKEFYMCDKSLLHIAKELHISYENCRVIKHRAIKKLMDTVKMH